MFKRITKGGGKRKLQTKTRKGNRAFDSPTEKSGDGRSKLRKGTAGTPGGRVDTRKKRIGGPERRS